MAALPTPISELRVNARPGGVTRFIQEGTGFTSTPTVTVTDEFTADPYVFTTTSVDVLSNKRLLVTVACTPPTTRRAARTRIRVVTSTGDDSGPVPVILLTRREPIIDHTRFKNQRVRLGAGNPKSVLFLPITGYGDVIDAKAVANKGTWTVKARQQARRLKLTLTCTGITSPFAGDTTDAITVTLTAEDDTSAEVPVEVEYVTDTDDEDPDP